jgi:hypothetical protein
MVLQTIRRSGEDYLVKRTCTGDLLARSISHAVVRHRRQAETQVGGGVQNKVVAVIAAKGGAIAAVVVNRASLACPLDMEEMQRLIGIPILGSIPPAGDLCNAAQQRGVRSWLSTRGASPRRAWCRFPSTSPSWYEGVGRAILPGNSARSRLLSLAIFVGQVGNLQGRLPIGLGERSSSSRLSAWAAGGRHQNQKLRATGGRDLSRAGLQPRTRRISGLRVSFWRAWLRPPKKAACSQDWPPHYLYKVYSRGGAWRHPTHSGT